MFQQAHPAAPSGRIRGDHQPTRPRQPQDRRRLLREDVRASCESNSLGRHSYGGAVITWAGTDDRVAGLVYISALGPDEDETLQGEQDKFPKTDVFKSIEVADGRVWMLPEGIEYFAGDLTEEEQQVVYATANPPAADLFGQKVGGVAWRTKPSWNIVAVNDRSVHPDLERAAAKRMNGKITEVESSHVPMLSQPDVVLDVIRDAASSL